MKRFVDVDCRCNLLTKTSKACHSPIINVLLFFYKGLVILRWQMVRHF